MISEREFNDALRYQVNDLGNLVRGLELIIEYLTQQWSRGAQRALAHECRTILAELPPERLTPRLVLQLRSLMLIDDGEMGPARVAPQRVPPPNAASLLLVDRRPQASGLVREFWVAPAQPYVQIPGFPPEAESDFRQALVDGCRAAEAILEHAGVLPIYKLPEDYTFFIEPGTFAPNPRLQEPSAWLAAALSYFAFWSGLPLPGAVAATGYVDHRGQIGELEGLEAKITACLRERPEVQKILVLSHAAIPAADRHDPRIVSVGSLGEALAVMWGPDWEARLVPPKLSVYAALDRAVHAYEKDHAFPDALQRFSLLARFFQQTPQFPLRYRFLCDWRMASCHTHLGRPDRAGAVFLPWVQEAERLWQQGEISSEDYANFFASYGVHLQDVFAFQQATEILRAVLARVQAYRVTKRQQAKLVGTLGQVLMFHRDFAAAEHYLLQAYNLIEEEERPRECTYLGQLYMLWQRYDDALRYLDEGLTLNATVSLPGQQRGNKIFNGVWRARLWYERGEYAKALAAAEEVLALRPLDYPGCLAWKWKGMALLASGHEEEGYTALQESVTSHPPGFFRDSPNVRLIMNSARIELLKFCLESERACPNGLAHHVGEIVAALEAFPDAHPHFAAERASLAFWLQEGGTNPERLLTTLKTLAMKVVY